MTPVRNSAETGWMMPSNSATIAIGRAPAGACAPPPAPVARSRAAATSAIRMRAMARIVSPWGSDPGSDQGSDPGSDQGSDPGSDQGSDPGSEQGSDPRSDSEVKRAGRRVRLSNWLQCGSRIGGHDCQPVSQRPSRLERPSNGDQRLVRYGDVARSSPGTLALGCRMPHPEKQRVRGEQWIRTA